MPEPWYQFDNVSEVDSPALVVYPDRIAENIRRMIAIAGGTERLRPHIKTHKMSAIMRIQVEAGINKCKCSTLAEAAMAAAAGGTDILLAHQPVGPKLGKLAALAQRFPNVRFSTIVDDPRIAVALSEACASMGCRIDALIDLDVGMGRSGISPGQEALELYRMLPLLPGISPGGVHAYDGQIHDRDVAAREAVCEASMQAAVAFAAQLRGEGLPVPRLVAGGTPTFPIHARHADRECSPGTCVLSDAGYSAMYPDLDFLVAATVLTRVISKPAHNRLCLDLGHKAVAADPAGPRVVLLDPEDEGPLESTVVMHSEEHLAVDTPHADRFDVGDSLFGIPLHICPTCALHKEAIVAKDGRLTGTWRVDARDRV